MRISYLMAALTLSASAVSAQAGILDELQKASDLLKQVPAQLGSLPGPASATAENGAAARGRQVAGASALIEPFGMLAYPRASVEKTFVNPAMQVSMPLTPPEKTPDSKFASRYTVPMEGRVSLMMYQHKPDDSPLLIQRYYENLLTRQGFERLSYCQTPCTETAQHSFAWHEAVDPEHILNYTAPERPTFEVFYKSDALVLLLVGSYSNYYMTIVKVVEGQFLDQRPIESVRQLSRNAAAPIPQTPVAGTPTYQTPIAATPSPANGAAGNGKVESVAPADLSARLSKSKGVVVVQLTSDDPGCGYCVQSNPRYNTVAQVKAQEAEFLRVTWPVPYTKAFDDALAVTYGITGLPTFLTFKNGKVVKRVNGNYTAVQLGESLLQGVK